jgi:hypothetical protein
MLVVLVFAWFVWRNMPANQQPVISARPEIEKQQAVVASRTFDPNSPPPDMPPLSTGELAVCDSNFTANALVSGQSRKLDATHAMVTVTGVKMTLQLSITAWTPTGATEHVVEHEQGHREISEYFYKSADQLAAQIANRSLGKQIPVSGTDLNAAINETLQQIGAEITAEYGKELNAEATQLKFDEITDHGRNDIDAKDAVAEAIKETPGNPAQSAAASPSN